MDNQQIIDSTAQPSKMNWSAPEIISIPITETNKEPGTRDFDILGS